MRLLILCFALFCFVQSKAQQLFINEVSQGPSGAKEYVEFIVVGNPTCTSPAPCLDLRGIVLDDNNGTFAGGSGTGIAVGAVRFANNPFWSCIPQGTLILVYNELDVNAEIPPNDVSMSDGNCALVIPINSALFEGQAIGPTSSSNAYPPSASWIAGGGLWAQVAMSNSNDSFYLKQSITSATFLHSVSWGNNTNNTQIYFPTAGGFVFSMANTVDNDPTEQANWTTQAALGNETPGTPNNTANAEWIGAMNPDCGIVNPIVLTATSTNIPCGSVCTGTASVTISGGASPYGILWSNGATTASISNLCPGDYDVEITDAGGCTATEQVTVIQVAQNTIAAGTNQTVCQNTPISTISLATTNATGATFAGLPAGVSGSWAANVATISGTPTVSGTFNYTVSTTGGCPPADATGIITVTAQNTIALGTNQTVCINNPITTITLATTNATGATFSGLPAGVSGSWAGNVATISGTPTVAGTYNYTVTTTGGCAAAISSGTITVNTSLTINLTPTSTSCAQACNGSISSSVIGGVSPFTYVWNTGEFSANISNLCSGTYDLFVEDDAGCIGTANIFVDAGSTVITPTLVPTNETCEGACDGDIELTNISGGAQPLSYSWSNGAITQSITNLCPDDYTLTVTDANGCLAWSTLTVFPGASIVPVSITTTGPFETTDPAVQFVASAANGIWSADCGSCISASGLFQPSNVAPGTYQICVAVGAGACASNDCVDIIVTQGCIPQFTNASLTVCPEQAVSVNGQQLTQAGTYEWLFTDVNGCDSTHTLTFGYFAANDIEQTLHACIGDSIFVNNQYYFEPTTVSFPVFNSNGCTVSKNVTLNFSDCTVIPLEVFIPNTFTPNFDGVNDTFAISIVGGMLEQGYILNRWGNVIHTFKSDDLTWDGTSTNGEPASDGVYTYVVEVRGTDSGAIERYHGFVTIVR